MEFSGDMALWQQKIAESHRGHERRMAVFAALAVRPGQAVVDVGCGGGHLVREFGLSVGGGGRAVGIDVSVEQIEAARSLCSDLPMTELEVGDAANMALDDNAFDSAASVQTLEYIPDPDAVLNEVHRVLRRGGKAAFVSVCWDHWRFHGADPALNGRIHDVWRSHCRHQMLPLEMGPRLSSAGFCGIARRPIAFFDGALHENTFAFWAAKVVAGFAVQQGVPESDVDLWMKQLQDADNHGRFGFISVPVLTTAVAA